MSSQTLKIIIICICYSTILSIQIGTISNVQYSALNFNRTYSNVSYIECSCLALNISAIGWNYLFKNRTCQLIRNYSTNDTGMKTAINISFYFFHLPLDSSIDTNDYLCATVQWNTTYTIVASTSPSQLKNPHGIAFDPITKTIFIADKGNNRVIKYLQNSSVGEIVSISVPTLNPNVPIALAWGNRTGALYVAYEDKDVVVRVYPSNLTSSTTIIAGDGTKGTSLSQLKGPSGIAIDKNERYLYVSDKDNSRVLRWDLSNVTSNGTLVAGQTNVAGKTNTTLNKPRGINLNDANTALFIADKENHRIQRLELSTGMIITVAGDPDGNDGSNSVKLKQPLDVAIDLFDNIYVADSDNDRIQIFCNSSTNGTTLFSSAGFKKPSSIFIDELFNLFVSDKDNDRVLKFNSIP